MVLNILCGTAQAQFAAPIRPAPYMLPPFTQNQVQPMAFGSWPQSSFPTPVYSFPQPVRWPMPIYSNYPSQYQSSFYPPMGGFGGMGNGMGLNLKFDLSSLFSGFANSNSDFAVPESEPYCSRCEARRRRLEPINYDDDNRPAPRRHYVERSDSATEAGVIGVRDPAPIPYPETTQDDRVARSESLAAPAPVRAPARRAPRPSTYDRGYVEEPYELSPAQQLMIRTTNRDERSALNAPIWPAFMRAFQQCAPGCRPIQFAAFGHREHATCHSKSEALDVHGMVCPTAQGPMTFMAINRGAFQKMVMCMRTKMEKVLYFNGPDQTEGHQNHAHFSNGCIRSGHRMW